MSNASTDPILRNVDGIIVDTKACKHQRGWVMRIDGLVVINGKCFPDEDMVDDGLGATCVECGESMNHTPEVDAWKLEHIIVRVWGAEGVYVGA